MRLLNNNLKKHIEIMLSIAEIFLDWSNMHFAKKMYVFISFV